MKQRFIGTNFDDWSTLFAMCGCVVSTVVLARIIPCALCKDHYENSAVKLSCHVLLVFLFYFLHVNVLIFYIEISHTYFDDQISEVVDSFM